MSASVIGLTAEVRIPQSESVHLNETAPRVDKHIAEVRTVQKSTEVDEPGLCYDAAWEVDLVSAARSGDHCAFVELCRRYSPSLKRTIRRIVGNREDAEDVFQDTIVSAFRHLAGFRANSSFRTWITTIANNNSVMLLRKRKSHLEIGFGMITADGITVETLEISDPMPNPEQVYTSRQRSQKIAQAVRKLPPDLRLVVERYYHDEARVVDVANAIGVTEAAAKSRLLRARKALRRHLTE